MLAKSVIVSSLLLAPGALAASAYGQCGGKGWTGDTTCPSDYVCVASGEYYSQCVLGTNGGSNGSGSGQATTTTTTTSNRPSTTTVTTTRPPSAATTPGNTTRYWDCCKPSCSWPGKGGSGPAKSCAKDGVTALGSNTMNSCDGGSAYTCNSYQPIVVNDNLSYGFAAAKIAGLSESDWCCACYELNFTTGPVAGKQMIVQVLNTGGDLGPGHFDLQIPGGGVGLFNGCQSQWGAPGSGWGAQYGGISSASDCSQLPAQLQSGCNWRFGWFKNADNPLVNFRKVTCPSELTGASGCSHA
uniref:Cellulase n=1 Tax=Rhizophlyctis rosea TaxID=64517 RepID=A0A2U8LMQ2_9FUNG|nr:glycoside hydrolase 45 [Rhizophlyctis rosea]